MPTPATPILTARQQLTLDAARRLHDRGEEVTNRAVSRESGVPAETVKTYRSHIAALGLWPFPVETGGGSCPRHDAATRCAQVLEAASRLEAEGVGVSDGTVSRELHASRETVRMARSLLEAEGRWPFEQGAGAARGQRPAPRPAPHAGGGRRHRGAHRGGPGREGRRRPRQGPPRGERPRDPARPDDPGRRAEARMIARLIFSCGAWAVLVPMWLVHWWTPRSYRKWRRR